MTILPQRLLDPTDTINARLRAFIATMPKNIILSNHHEADDKSAGLFTPSQFRAGIVKFAGLVRAQNVVDGGTRRTSVVLMNISFKGQWTWPISDWWPTDAQDGGRVDLIAADVYALPHATLTACSPRGYTDGVNWKQASRLLSFMITFAKANKSPWALRSSATARTFTTLRARHWRSATPSTSREPTAGERALSRPGRGVGIRPSRRRYVREQIADVIDEPSRLVETI